MKFNGDGIVTVESVEEIMGLALVNVSQIYDEAVALARLDPPEPLTTTSGHVAAFLVNTYPGEMTHVGQAAYRLLLETSERQRREVEDAQG